MKDTLTPAEASSAERTAVREVQYAQKRYHQQENPKAVLLAGQPGAGKTMLSSLILPRLGNDAVLINGDDYRRYHPDYKSLYEKYGSDSVAMTSAFSGTVTEILIERLSNLKYNLVIEGTGRTVEVPKGTAERLTAKGFAVEMAVIATRPLLSLISTVQRFYQMNERGTIPRATAIEAHDNVVSALPSNLDTLSECPYISKIMIWTRDAKLYYDSENDSSWPSAKLKHIWNKKWLASELADARSKIELLRAMEEKTSLGQGYVIDEIQRRFRREISRSREQSR